MRSPTREARATVNNNADSYKLKPGRTTMDHDPITKSCDRYHGDHVDVGDRPTAVRFRHGKPLYPRVIVTSCDTLVDPEDGRSVSEEGGGGIG